MGIVIPMDVLQNKIKKQTEKNSKMSLPQKKHDACKDNEADTFKELVDRGVQYKEEFLCKYHDVIKNEPKRCVSRMSYYLDQMHMLIPVVFHAQNHDNEWDAYSDFSYFQTDFFDLAYSDFYKKHKKDIDNEYVFKKPKLSKKDLEEEMYICISNLYILFKSAHKNAAQVIETVSRFYELTWALDDIFLDKLGIYE